MAVRSRRWLVAGASLLLVAVVAVVAWRFDARTRPEAVGPRFGEALLSRRPGTTIDAWEGGVMRITLPSGVYIDVRLSTVFDRCRTARFACSTAIDAALDDVDHADAATRAPRRSMLSATVVGDATPGIGLGFVTRPFAGGLEVRYVLVNGVTSTFVTSAIADRLGMTRTAIDEAALAAVRAERDVALEKIDTTYRVRSTIEPVASLLDPERMKRFATTLGAKRLYAVVPSRGALAVAPARPDEAKALAGLLKRDAYGNPRPGDAGLLAWDVDAPAGAELTAVATPDLR